MLATVERKIIYWVLALLAALMLLGAPFVAQSVSANCEGTNTSVCKG
ncbi:MAG: hypothetical protein AAF490_18645 [Chloroflexota bacterium]